MRTVIGIFAGMFGIVTIVCVALAMGVNNPHGVDYPVILVHGYGNSGDTWLSKGYQKFRNDQCLYVGNIRTREGKVECDFRREDEWRAKYPWYTVSLANKGFGPIEESAKELATFIEFVKLETGARRVALVGYSLGGIVCREYVTGDGYMGDVCRLVTVSSPHLGTGFAALPKLSALLAEKSRNSRSRWVRSACGTCQKAAEGFLRRHNVDLSSPALKMLCPPEPGNYLYRLNRRYHPTDIRYGCITTTKGVATTSLRDLSEDLRTLKESLGRDFTKTALFADLANLAGFLAGELGGLETEGRGALTGDGFVPERSQDLRNVHFFRTCPDVEVDYRSVACSHLGESYQRDFVQMMAIPAP